MQKNICNQTPSGVCKSPSVLTQSWTQSLQSLFCCNISGLESHRIGANPWTSLIKGFCFQPILLSLRCPISSFMRVLIKPLPWQKVQRQRLSAIRTPTSLEILNYFRVDCGCFVPKWPAPLAQGTPVGSGEREEKKGTGSLYTEVAVAPRAGRISKDGGIMHRVESRHRGMFVIIQP